MNFILYNILLLTILCITQYNVIRGDYVEHNNELLNSLILELRRGSIVLGVLSCLEKPQYGYSLISILEENNLLVDPGTLYPLLRRLEKNGMLISRWDTAESRPRKYYELSVLGKEVFNELKKEWNSLVLSINKLIKEMGD